MFNSKKSYMVSHIGQKLFKTASMLRIGCADSAFGSRICENLAILYLSHCSKELRPSRVQIGSRLKKLSFLDIL